MAFLLPDIYKQSIFDIDYNKLYKKNIKCLVFDLDNTLALISDKNCPEETKELITKLKKKFRVVMISNNISSRIKPYEEELEIDTISLAMKPLTFGLKKIRKRYNLKKCEMIMIGDQLVTDVLSGKIYGTHTCLVDPLGKKDIKITGLNRKIEKVILNNYEKKKLFERGIYYE